MRTASRVMPDQGLGSYSPFGPAPGVFTTTTPTKNQTMNLYQVCYTIEEDPEAAMVLAEDWNDAANNLAANLNCRFNESAEDTNFAVLSIELCATTYTGNADHLGIPVLVRPMPHKMKKKSCCPHTDDDDEACEDDED